MKFLPCALVAPLLALAFSGSTQLATAKPVTAPATLSFQVTARIFSKEAKGATSSAQQLVNAKVYASGNRVRLESQLGGAPIVFLYIPPYAYKLLPTSKTGVRYPASTLPVAGSGTNADLQAVLRNPAGLRSSVQKRGARHMGKTRLNGVPVDLYVGNGFHFLGQTYKARTWLRQSDALPLRLELTSAKASVIVSWRDYQRGRAYSSRLFAVPAGYSIMSRAQSPG